jgi:hypothetical protein
MTTPCRPCDQRPVRITRAELKAYEIAAITGRRAKADLADALKTIASLRSQVASLTAQLAAKTP